MEPDVHYELWWEKAGKKTRSYSMYHPEFDVVATWAKGSNEDEKADAEVEQRPIRKRYFVVKATTTFEEVVGVDDPRPHSRACGIASHPHGRLCAPDCPTCHP